MRLVTLDFETFFSNDYTLSKMTTEEYIRDPRFKAHLVGVKVGDEAATWIMPDELRSAYWRATIMPNALLCHHAHFDGLILAHHYSLKPAFWFDTLSMSRLIFGTEVGGSLAKLTKHFKLPDKNVPYNLFKGLRDLPRDIMDQLGAGCAHDVELTYIIFKKLLPLIPRSELRIIDQTIRMFTEPKLLLDVPAAQTELDSQRAKKASLLAKIGATAKEMASSAQFKTLLEALGVPCPMKTSPTNPEKEIPALSKTDQGMKDLMEHENETVQAMAAARLGVKSTIGETRAERLLGMATRGPLPVYLKYAGAHTIRFAGGDKVNWQNFTPALKKCIVAPKGYRAVTVDSSQVECRGVNWLAGQWDILDKFARGVDIYSENSTAFYGRQITRADKKERHLGKTIELGCFGPDTIVLTKDGLKVILEITKDDWLWDGVEWVQSSGVVARGERETVILDGITLTPDHEILCGTQWRCAEDILQSENTHSQALATALERLPSPAIRWEFREAWNSSLFNVPVDGPSIWWPITTSAAVEALAAMRALSPAAALGQSTIGDMPTWCLMMNIGGDFSIEFPLSSPGVIPKGATATMGSAVSYVSTDGLKTVDPSSPICSPSPDGMTLSWKLIGKTTLKGTSRAIYDLLRATKTQQTAAQSEGLKPKLQTYDIALAGPRSRFTIVGARGPLIAHNCGYGMSAGKFQIVCRQGALGGPPIILTDEEAKAAVSLYRTSHPQVVRLWREGDRILEALFSGASCDWGPLRCHRQALWLPNGAPLWYRGLERHMDDGRVQFTVDRGRGPQRVYGALVVENITQALFSGLLIREAMLRIGARYPVVLQVHDDITFLAPEAEADEALAFALAEMKRVPSWCPGIPLDAEGGHSERYDK